MATLTLGTVWLNLAANPVQFLTLSHATAVQLQPVNPQTDRMYGGGRIRAVSAGAIQEVFAVSVASVSPADLAVLRTWNGRILWYRDDAGNKFACSYKNLAVSRHQYNTRADVTFTVTQKTLSEAA